VSHGVFEVYSLPFSSVALPGLEMSRSPGSLPMMGGA